MVLDLKVQIPYIRESKRREKRERESARRR
jgi:hypothetical protein